MRTKNWMFCKIADRTWKCFPRACKIEGFWCLCTHTITGKPCHSTPQTCTNHMFVWMFSEICSCTLFSISRHAQLKPMDSPVLPSHFPAGTRWRCPTCAFGCWDKNYEAQTFERKLHGDFIWDIPGDVTAIGWQILFDGKSDSTFIIYSTSEIHVVDGPNTKDCKWHHNLQFQCCWWYKHNLHLHFEPRWSESGPTLPPRQESLCRLCNSMYKQTAEGRCRGGGHSCERLVALWTWHDLSCLGSPFLTLSAQHLANRRSETSLSYRPQRSPWLPLLPDRLIKVVTLSTTPFVGARQGLATCGAASRLLSLPPPSLPPSPPPL